VLVLLGPTLDAAAAAPPGRGVIVISLGPLFAGVLAGFGVGFAVGTTVGVSVWEVVP